MSQSVFVVPVPKRGHISELTFAEKLPWYIAREEPGVMGAVHTDEVKKPMSFCVRCTGDMVLEHFHTFYKCSCTSSALVPQLP